VRYVRERLHGPCFAVAGHGRRVSPSVDVIHRAPAPPPASRRSLLRPVGCVAGRAAESHSRRRDHAGASVKTMAMRFPWYWAKPSGTTQGVVGRRRLPFGCGVTSFTPFPPTERRTRRLPGTYRCPPGAGGLRLADDRQMCPLGHASGPPQHAPAGR